MVTIAEDQDGRIDQAHLAPRTGAVRGAAAEDRQLLGRQQRDRHRLGHRRHLAAAAPHGALAFWDFAAAAPYVQIEMNLRGAGRIGALAYKDAVFISPHKFIGGPGTPGVLVVKRQLLTNTVPTVPGGGTVSLRRARPGTPT